MVVDFWEVAVRGALESGEPIDFLISGTLWAIFVALVLIFKYEVHPAISLPLAPIVVVGGAFLLFGGLIALLQTLVAIVVPALVLFFITILIPSGVGSD